MKRWLLLALTGTLFTYLQTQSCAHSGLITSALNQVDTRELIVVNQQVWYLSANGVISIYDSNGTQITVPSIQNVTAQHITTDGSDVLAQIGDKLQRWVSSDSTWHYIGPMRESVFALTVDSQHRIFAITSKGVWNMEKKSFQLPVSSPNDQIKQIKLFSAPSAHFMDAQDKLWIGYGYGEWGGNIFTYDTQRGKFVDLTFNNFQINLYPVKSFFQFKSTVGVSAGLQHMSNSGLVAGFQDLSARVIYNTRNDIDTTTRENRWKSANELPYIGPATYEPDTECIYFYCNKGVFKGHYQNDLSKLSSWQLVFTPKLHWRNGQPDAVGSPINVLKMCALGNGKLVLLTQNDGVGIWDGANFKLLP